MYLYLGHIYVMAMFYRYAYIPTFIFENMTQH